ncbi:MAG: hypothetical protein QM589_13470 [Thermomicrobiales bacterium]
MFGFRKISSACVAVVLVLLTMVIPQSTLAQDNDTVTVYLRPEVNGTPISQMCLQLENASNTGCDENGDGYIAFQDIHPGTYTVLQETIIAGIVQLGDNVTITVADSPAEQYFDIAFTSMVDDTPTVVPTAPTDDDTVTVYLQPVIAETGVALTPMCLKLGDASNTGCDENGDGSIEFQGMHPGTYPVQQMRAVAGVEQLGDDVTITVADSPAEQYFTIDFHEMDQGGTTPVPTVAPTVAPPASGSQDTGNGSSNTSSPAGSTATSLPNTGSGSTASMDTFSLATLALLAVASIATMTASLLRWRRPRA